MNSYPVNKDRLSYIISTVIADVRVAQLNEKTYYFVQFVGREVRCKSN